MKNFYIMIIAVLLVSMLIIGCSKTEVNYTIEELDGYDFVHNNEIELTELGLEPELILGSEDQSTEEDVFFSGIAQVMESASGDIYVLDMAGSSISLFSYEGKLLRKIGREGQGPGEFNRPFGMTIMPSGNLLVADTDNQRYQIFDQEGNFVNSHKMETDFPGRITYDKEGNLVNHSTAMNFTQETAEPLFYLYDEEFKQKGKIGVKQEGEMVEKYFNNLSFYTVNSKNRIITSLSARNEFTIFEAGNISRKFDRSLNYKIKEVAVETVQDGDQMSMTISYEPICFGIAVDSRDNIYALTKYKQEDAADEENPDYYSVLEIFDPNGIQLKRIPLRNMGAGGIALGKDDKIYIVNDENATVVRYPAL